MEKALVKLRRQPLLQNEQSPFVAKDFQGDVLNLTEDQQERLAAFRRSRLDQAKMRRVFENLAGHKPTLQMTIVLCGVAKLFVGDLTEAAVIISATRQEDRPLKREHILAAFRELKRKQAPPQPNQEKRIRL